VRARPSQHVPTVLSRAEVQAVLHDLNDAATKLTVYARRLELIMPYVRWAAFQELAATESSDPNASKLAMPACWYHPPGALHP
jgi:hypothetical protein